MSKINFLAQLHSSMLQAAQNYRLLLHWAISSSSWWWASSKSHIGQDDDDDEKQQHQLQFPKRRHRANWEAQTSEGQHGIAQNSGESTLQGHNEGDIERLRSDKCNCTGYDRANIRGDGWRLFENCWKMRKSIISTFFMFIIIVVVK